jgi:hypothetical protein
MATNKIKIDTNRKTLSKHLGNARALVSNGKQFTHCIKPSYEELATYAYLKRSEPIISSGLNFITLAILKKYGPYQHIDPSISAFINKILSTKLHIWLESAIMSALWSGWAVGEIQNEVTQVNVNGNIDLYYGIKDIYFYPPASTYFLLNDNGILTHGEKVFYDIYHTGAWVPAPTYLIDKQEIGADYSGAHIRLEELKLCHLTLGIQSNTNPYGTSHIGPVLKFPFYKEVIDSQFLTALDRYSNPLVAIIVPEEDTNEIVEEADGEKRKKRYFEAVGEEIESMNQNAENPFFVMEQPKGDAKIEIKPLTTGNNYADAFINGLDYYESQILRGMAIPNLLFKDTNSKLGSGGSSERQMEAFVMFISSFFKKTQLCILNSIVKNLITLNYGDPSLLEGGLGSFTELPLRVADIKDLASSAKQLGEAGIFNPNDTNQRQYYQDIFGLPHDN